MANRKREHEFTTEELQRRMMVERFSLTTLHQCIRVSLKKKCTRVCLFVCGISLTSGQLFYELFPDCTRSCFSQVYFTLQGR